MRIAVVDDQAQARDLLISYIKSACSDMEISDVQIDYYNDGIEIIDQYKNYYDLIYLDVEMSMMDGMTTAHKIRERDDKVLLVFVTNHAQVAIQGYAVEASDFLLKPLSQFIFKEHFKKIIKKINREVNYITIKESGILRRLDLKKIYYIESQGHYIDFVTSEGRFTVIDSMKSLEQKLPATSFFRCNNSFIINFDYVDKLSKTEVVVAHTTIQISRARKKDMSDKYMAYLSDIY